MTLPKPLLPEDMLKCVDRQDPLEQVEMIGNLINQYNVKQAVADIGYGAVQVSELQKMFAGRVLGCQYVRRPELSLERETTDEYGNKIAQLCLLADRSFWLESAIGLVKFKDKNSYVIPYAYPANVEWFFDHFTQRNMPLSVTFPQVYRLEYKR